MVEAAGVVPPVSVDTAQLIDFSSYRKARFGLIFGSTVQTLYKNFTELQERQRPFYSRVEFP